MKWIWAILQNINELYSNAMSTHCWRVSYQIQCICLCAINLITIWFRLLNYILTSRHSNKDFYTPCTSFIGVCMYCTARVTTDDWNNNNNQHFDGPLRANEPLLSSLFFFNVFTISSHIYRWFGRFGIPVYGIPIYTLYIQYIYESLCGSTNE